MVRSIFHLLLLLPLIYTSEEKKDIVQNRAVVNCYTSQAAPIEDKFVNVFIDSDKENCTNDYCMLLWGKTKDNLTRILAQGCAKGGERFDPGPNAPKMQNECPSGTGLAPQIKPILMGEEGATILRTLTHMQICMCYTDYCNEPQKKDGESCEGDDTPFCNPLDSQFKPSRSEDYSPEGNLNKSKQSTDPPEDREPEGPPDPGRKLREWLATLSTLQLIPLFLGSTLILAIIVGIGTIFIRRLLCGDKPEQKYHHTSGRLNSIAQVTILTEVAQGYKQEGEDLIRESQAGGIHQIANWKYDGATILGIGSFGAVYKVDMKPDYLVDAKMAALKTFSHMRSTHFFNESRTLRYVHDFKNHPNIIQYLGRAVDCRDTLEEATWRIALELCEGGCLRDWITYTHITLSQFLEASSGLLSALSFLHCEETVQTSLLSSIRGNSTDSGNPDSRSNSRSRRSSKQVIKKKFRIAHCDINSRNILVRNAITGNIVLADFGLALTDKEKRQEEVQIREIGTIRYLSPEMLQSLINLGDAFGSLILADTYATGLVLWELLSRTVELYEDDSEVPLYSPPYEKELSDMEGATANRFEAMLNVVVRRGIRPSWGGKWNDLNGREEEAMSRDEESDLNDEEKFLHSCISGINSMLAKEAEARLTIPAMAEKVDTYRLQRQRIPEERRSRSREDSLLDETSGSN